jgi:hypothetical protein
VYLQLLVQLQLLAAALLQQQQQGPISENLAGVSEADAATAGSNDAAASSSSGGTQVKCGCLAELLCSSDWTQTTAAFDSKWPDMPAVLDCHKKAAELVPAGSSSSSSSSSSSISDASAGNPQQQAADNVSQLYSEALELCRRLWLLLRCRWCATTLPVRTWRV